MNGSQDIRPPYTGAQPPLPAQPQPEIDPGLGPVPPTWRKNIYGYGDDPRRKSPVLAFILSAMPGLGQIYVGYYQQGFAHVLIVALIIGLLGGAAHNMRGLGPMLGFFLAFFWLYNMIDAFRRASFYNQALAGMTSVEMPPEIKMPKGQGSLIGGVALIVFGGLILANTAFGVSLDWLDEWWPAVLVLMGIYLVWANISARREAGMRAEQTPRA